MTKGIFFWALCFDLKLLETRIAVSYLSSDSVWAPFDIYNKLRFDTLIIN